MSEYFSEKGELQADIINSIPFRNKYYVQIFDQFFIPKEVSGGGNLGQITNPSGDVTGNINLEDIVGQRNINGRRFNIRTNYRKYGF